VLFVDLPLPLIQRVATVVVLGETIRKSNLRRLLMLFVLLLGLVNHTLKHSLLLVNAIGVDDALAGPTMVLRIIPLLLMLLHLRMLLLLLAMLPLGIHLLLHLRLLLLMTLSASPPVLLLPQWLLDQFEEALFWMKMVLN
jgi:hypothetical protein